MTLIVLTLLFLTIWNIIWVSFTDIYEIQAKKSRVGGAWSYDDLYTFDCIMFLTQKGVTFMIYYILIVAGPVDICQTYMLSSNRRIYVLLMCTSGAIKYFIEAFFFVSQKKSIAKMDFAIERLIIIALTLCTVAVLINNVREEISEIQN